jgi:precorrin-2 C20-methyltransferase/precorrin-3B C17-methyltransferase
VLTVLPGTLPPEDLAARLAGTDSAAIMKLGRTFDGVRDALTRAGRLDDAWYVERATTNQERAGRIADIDPATVPYFSLALLPSAAGSRRNTPPPPHPGPHATGQPQAAQPQAAQLQAAQPPTERQQVERPQAGGPPTPTETGAITVVGLGPGGRDWLTPEAQAALAAADDLVGYGPYLDRVPPNPRQRRHPSDNRVEAERAAFALDLAKRGRQVAVVSSGDPGVFAMATAVLEVSEDPLWKDVPIRIVPGITAAQAVASRVGAPLGHDFCVLSLSDRLKPWPVIESRLIAAVTADLVIAIYNPASRSRTEQLVRARELLLERCAPDTPVVIGRDVGGPAESVRVTTLAGLDPVAIDMRCMLIIGSSQTRATVRGDGSPLVYTPRNYPG